MSLTVTVVGVPVGQGNIRHLGKGRPAVHQNAKRLKPWRQRIADAAREEMAAQGVDLIPSPTPVELHATFAVKRPQRPKSWAPVVRPDLDHYLRALCDSLSGVLVEDDAQIVSVWVSKVYPTDGHLPGVTFTVAPAVRGEQVAA